MDDISESNPCLEEMKERGWAWVQRSTVSDEYGAVYTDDEYAADAVRRFYEDEGGGGLGSHHQELLIVSWE